MSEIIFIKTSPGLRHHIIYNIPRSISTHSLTGAGWCLFLSAHIQSRLCRQNQLNVQKLNSDYSKYGAPLRRVSRLRSPFSYRDRVSTTRVLQAVSVDHVSAQRLPLHLPIT